MKQRVIALLLVLAMVSAVVVSAVAEEPAQENGEVTAIQVVELAEQPEDAENIAETEEATSAQPEPAEKPAETAGNETPVPGTTVDTLKFDELEALVKKNNLSYKSLDATISGMGTLDDMANEMKEGILQIEMTLATLKQDPVTNAEQISIWEGEKMKLQEGLSGVSSMKQDTSQMEAGRKQLIMGAQSVFIALVGMERQEAALERQLAALDRTVEEMELRNDMGQISQLQLMELQSGRTQLISGLTTLRMNITNYKMQLEQMIGKEMTGKIALGTVPTVTEAELNALNLEENLKSVLKNSFDLKAAIASRDKLDDLAASAPAMASPISDMQNGAEYTYKATRQQVEMKFRILYAQLQDCRQLVDAAEVALDCEKLACEAAELKYAQGAISENALLTAQDELAAAKDAVQTAKENLFSTYNNYCWAVKHGVLS